MSDPKPYTLEEIDTFTGHDEGTSRARIRATVEALAAETKAHLETRVEYGKLLVAITKSETELAAAEARLRETVEQRDAAREEQREATLEAMRYRASLFGSGSPEREVLHRMMDAIRATPLDATPLGDRIDGLLALLEGQKAFTAANRLEADAECARAEAAEATILDLRADLDRKRTWADEQLDALHKRLAARDAEVTDLRAAAESAANVARTLTGERDEKEQTIRAYEAKRMEDHRKHVAALAALTEERDAAREARHQLAWDSATAAEEHERVRSILGAATVRLEQAEAELTAERALADATQVDLESRDAAYAERVAALTGERDALREFAAAVQRWHDNMRCADMPGLVDHLFVRLTALSATSEAKP